MAAVVTTLPADKDAAPERVAVGGSTTSGARVVPGGTRVGAADGPLVKEKSLEPAVGAELEMSPKEVGAEVGTPVPKALDPAVGAAVWPAGVGAIVKAKSREPALGAGVAPAAIGAMVPSGAVAAGLGAMVPLGAMAAGLGVMVPLGASVTGATGDGVKVPLPITQGASPQGVPVAAMVAEQQSEEPAVPATSPQPTPPQTPLQASAQQMFPSATPGIPLGQVEGVTSAERKHEGRMARGEERRLSNHGYKKEGI